MHFLINNKDNSVNCVSEQMFPQFMIHQGLSYYELPVDHLPENENLFLCFYDPSTNSIIPNSQGLIRLTTNEFKEYIDQQQLIQTAIKKNSESEKWNKLVNFLNQVFPNNSTINEILADNEVTTDELQQIENMLNGQ